MSTGPATREEAARSVKWNAVALIGREGFRMLFALALARWLGPENFGIMTQAQLYVLFMALFLLDGGLGLALIQRKDMSEREEGTVFWAGLVVGTLLAALTVAVAPLIADFFATPELTDVLRVLSIGVLVKALTVVPQALVQRRMRFKALAAAEIGSALLSGILGIVAAAMGADYWALVVQALALDVFLLLALVAAAGRFSIRGDWATMRSLWNFSANATGFGVLNYATRNLDNVLIGRFLGTVPLAQYALSYRVMMLPIQNLTLVVNRVALPMYSQLQDDLPRLRRQYLASTRMVALITFPLMVGVIVAAPSGVPAVFGPEWLGAIAPMQILAIAGLQQALTSLMGPVILACGRADWLFRYKLVTSFFVIGAFIIGVQWDVNGVAISFVVVSLLLTPTNAWLVRKLIDLPRGAFIRALTPTAAAALVALAAGGGTAAACANLPTSDLVEAIVSYAVVCLVFVAALRLIRPTELDEARSFARLMRSRRAVAAPA